MRIIAAFIILMVCGLSAAGQRDSVIVNDGWRKDTVRVKGQVIDTLGKGTEMIIWDNTVRESEEERRNNMVKLPLAFRVFPDRESRPNKFRGHWNGFYFGFVNFGKTNYSKYGGDDFMELDWASSFTMHFNFAKFSFGLSPRQRFGIFTGFGLDYSRLCFDGDITVRRKKGEMLHAVALSDLGIEEVKRSTFKALYLTIPLMLEKQIPAPHWKRFYVSTGFIGGIRLHSKTKVVYTSEKGNKRKLKENGSYGMVPFKVDYTLRVGYRGVCIWGNYSLTNMFNKNRAPELRPFAVGFGITI
ncbi:MULTISPECIES: hypothetical protein [Butyricimonas]|uniref:hypothetical protein n=1 Tax=Butyricimonas TaxID=574697 RepID=UPI00208C8CF8|nr:hypothetical protein [Butyricimonas paravirosa]BDF53523.1 hypothetical protein CE91St21_09580 [Odoribacteraceae bacterium]GKH92462.1 hypothetical protein CE91St23_09580 [Odoribacteraceae bacterium]GKH97080.1 hypothetical protein CE91St22_09580 [Odoribacteraceae bacterium]GKI03959.1 hypothetical protein CE91St24_32340 [Odoribacteraceae bacterium]